MGPLLRPAAREGVSGWRRATGFRRDKPQGLVALLARRTDADHQGAAERLALDDLDAHADADPLFGEVTQQVGVGVVDPDDHACGSGGDLGEQEGLALDDLALAGGDGVAVRVHPRIAEVIGDALDELVGDHVLQDLASSCTSSHE